jgi:hypothetical protein
VQKQLEVAYHALQKRTWLLSKEARTFWSSPVGLVVSFRLSHHAHHAHHADSYSNNYTTNYIRQDPTPPSDLDYVGNVIQSLVGIDGKYLGPSHGVSWVEVGKWPIGTIFIYQQTNKVINCHGVYVAS